MSQDVCGRLIVDYLGREGRLATATGLASDVSDLVDLVPPHPASRHPALEPYARQQPRRHCAL